jgi:predicted CopG family antitoxin
MATRTVSLAEDAYEALLAMKLPGESFSDIVRLLTRRESLADLSTAMDVKAAESVARVIESSRQERPERRKRGVGTP